MNDVIRCAAEKWRLTDLCTIYERAAKAVFRADSREFGPVILKWNQNGRELRSEAAMLIRLNGKNACKVYDFDELHGLLLEECILPGNVLREEPSLEKRVRAFSDVFQTIHTPSADCKNETYLDWLTSANEYCKTHPTDPELARMTAEAHAVCEELFGKYPDRVLLHGDLHHDNLLLRADGTYTMIDPKGVVGPAIFDLPRYILNETDTAHSDPDDVHITAVIRRLADTLGYPADDVANLYFMEAVLENVWSHEDGEPVSREDLALAEKIKNK